MLRRDRTPVMLTWLHQQSILHSPKPATHAGVEGQSCIRELMDGYRALGCNPEHSSIPGSTASDCRTVYCPSLAENQADGAGTVG
jgi:hypothetical protein